MQGRASWSQANILGQSWLCWLKTSRQQSRGPDCHTAHTAQPLQAASAEARTFPGNPMLIFFPAQKNKSFFMLVLPGAVGLRGSL